MPYHLVEKKSDLIIPKDVRNIYYNMIYFLNQKKFALNELEASFILTNLKYDYAFKYKYNISYDKVNWNNQKYNISYRVKSTPEQIENPFKIKYIKNRKNIINYKLNMDYYPMVSQITYNTCEFFEGQIKNEEPNGYGTLKLNEHMIYEGPFLNGLFHGYGLIRFSNDMYYATHFENGLSLNGGTLYSEDFIYEENIYNKSNKLFGLYEVLVNYKNNYKIRFASKNIITSSYKSIGSKKRVIPSDDDYIPSAKKAKCNPFQSLNHSLSLNLEPNLNQNRTSNIQLFPIKDYKSWMNTSQNIMSKNLKNI
jgi:hypothetical protein